MPADFQYWRKPRLKILQVIQAIHRAKIGKNDIDRRTYIFRNTVIGIPLFNLDVMISNLVNFGAKLIKHHFRLVGRQHFCSLAAEPYGVIAGATSNLQNSLACP